MTEPVKNYFGWIGTFLVLIGYYLNANQITLCWPVWIIGNFLVGIYSLQKEAYPTAVLSFTLVIMSIYGYFKWL
tara:strand:- start:256 stop:477 length:222 start_codon:yes stop_codon:yes gene_type:complete